MYLMMLIKQTTHKERNRKKMYRIKGKVGCVIYKIPYRSAVPGLSDDIEKSHWKLKVRRMMEICKEGEGTRR